MTIGGQQSPEEREDLKRKEGAAAPFYSKEGRSL